MKKTTLFLTFILASFMFNITEASFPVTKKITTEKSNIENVVLDSDKATWKKKLKEYFAGDLDWGAFFLGFLLGLIGVLIVFVMDGDTRSAWKGFAVWVLLLLAIILVAASAVDPYYNDYYYY